MPPKRASRSRTNKEKDVQDVVMAGNAPEVAVESASDEPISDLKAILQQSVKRTRELFAEDQENIYAGPVEDQESQRVKLQSKIYDEYKQVQVLPYPLLKRQKEQLEKKKTKGGSASAPSGGEAVADSGVEKILESMSKKAGSTQHPSTLVMHKPTIHNPFPDAPGGGSSLVRRPVAKAIWDLESERLKLSLTGHIGQVRGLAVSSRHPYLFSCGDDKMVKCWDLETNKVIRHYHGHLSGVYAMALHPTLDVLVTSGRDATARHSQTLGFGGRKDNDDVDTPQEGCSRYDLASKSLHLQQQVQAISNNGSAQG
ncbi:hypothetical protein BG011_001703, partial [Mortierella polycephala]